ncbi:hypothetical protein ABTM42_21035, partial [Acinetobacter baumannii]
TIYANAYVTYLADRDAAKRGALDVAADSRVRPEVREVLALIAEGGYHAAFARVGFLLAGTDDPIPLSLLTTAQALIRDYA